MAFQRLAIAYLLIFAFMQAFFAAFPRADLLVSALFADGSQGFDWASGTAPMVNLAVRRAGEGATLLLLLGILYGVMTGKARGDQIRLLAYPVLCVALASGFVVNFLLKTHIGRARPDRIAEFGGTAQFTPPWQLAEECARNCSFASGEVAMAAALAIPLVVLLWPHLKRTRGRVLAVAVAVAYVAFVSVLRVGLGRHFFSDAVFSTLFAAGAALVLYPVLNVGRAKLHLPGLIYRRPPMALAEQRGVF